MLLCPISPVCTLAGEEGKYRVMGLCIHSFSPPQVSPCALPSSAGCPNQTASWLKLSFKNILPPPSSPTGKAPSPKGLRGPNVRATLMRGFVCVIYRQSETMSVGHRVRLSLKQSPETLYSDLMNAFRQSNTVFYCIPFLVCLKILERV